MKVIDYIVIGLVLFSMVLGMIFGSEPVFELCNFNFKIADIIFVVGGIPMYYEMIRLQIQLFKRLSVKEHEKK